MYINSGVHQKTTRGEEDIMGLPFGLVPRQVFFCFVLGGFCHKFWFGLVWFGLLGVW